MMKMRHKETVLPFHGIVLIEIRHMKDIAGWHGTRVFQPQHEEVVTALHHSKQIDRAFLQIVLIAAMASKYILTPWL